MRVELMGAGTGPIVQVGSAPKLSATPGTPRSTAPESGAHTDEVLASPGLDAERIEALRGAGVVA